MVRLLSLLVIVGLVGSSCLWITAQDRARAALPLDLPSGGVGDDEDEEDAPEVITFYGADFEGDAFFWVLDKSGSMSWNGEINTLKAETTRTLGQLSANSEFSLVSFSTSTQVWSSFPKPANPGNKASAISWVQSINAAGWTCLMDAGVKAVNIANLSSKKYKKLLVLCDGEPICNGVDTKLQCLASITAANWQNIPIDCLYISADQGGIGFMQQLAAQNNGKFVLVQ